ncbi:MAG: hypothetical protein JNK40_05965 [Chromatiales bacterium]|nr:hypothetical protein [Chromatiales bacterium]
MGAPTKSNRATRKKAAANPKGTRRDKEMEHLRRELKRVSWELDFLKEAAAFLARTSRSGAR